MQTTIKNTVKQLLTDAMQEATEKASKHTVRKTQEISIYDIHPLELTYFIEENNIPKDCQFSTDGNNNPCILWDIVIPASEKEKQKELVRKFERLSWYKVRDYFISQGYSVKGSSSYYTFSIDKIYNSYINDIDLLVNYYIDRFYVVS